MRLVNNVWIFIFTYLFITSCNSQKHTKIELIASLIQSEWDNKTNQKVPEICVEIYAQIDNKRNCKVVRIPNRKVSRFSAFKIDKELFNKLTKSLSKIDSDTIISEYHEPCICDGPIIKLFIHDWNGKSYTVKYVLDKSSDSVYTDLYHFIDSYKLNTNKVYNFDTCLLLNDREIRIEQLKKDLYNTGFPSKDRLLIKK